MIYLIKLLVRAFWFILPAYFANATPVALGGGPPIDGGKKFSDGRRILGGGKTIRGLIVGVLAGGVIGGLQGLSLGTLKSLSTGLGGEMARDVVASLGGDYQLGLMLGLGAMLGDLTASFIKRRLNLRRGQAAPGLDQLDFVVGALLLGALIRPLPEWRIIAIILIATPLIHLTLNFMAYKLGYKSEPY